MFSELKCIEKKVAKSIDHLNTYEIGSHFHKVRWVPGFHIFTFKRECCVPSSGSRNPGPT